MGVALSALFIGSLVLPFLEEEAITGIRTGELSWEAFIPSLLLALLILLPAIRNLAVGNVSLDVSPVGAPTEGPNIDPTQVLPVFTQEELDASRLTRR